MTRFSLICFLLGLTFFQIMGQSLLILDSETRKPVADVYLFDVSQTSTAFTTMNGVVDLSTFQGADSIVLQHPSYENKRVSIAGMRQGEHKVFLTEKIVLFQELTVSANKWEQNSDNVAQQIISVDSKNIQSFNPQTSADLLTNTGQVFVQKSQYGGGSPTLRGFSANKVLLVIDGIRLNNAIYRSGNLQNVINIDPNAVDRVEVIMGPGSVIYGSDALGGVMDFKTVTPDFSFDDQLEITGSIMSRYATAANEKTSHLDIGLGKRRIAYWGSLSVSDFGDLEAGSVRSDGYKGFFLRPFYADRSNGQDVLKENKNQDLQLFTGFQSLNTIQKLTFRTGDNSDLSYAYYLSTTSDIPRYDRLTIPLNQTSDSLVYAEWYYGPQRWDMHALTHGYYRSTTLFDQLKSTFSYQTYEESRSDRSFGSNSRRTRSESVSILTGSVDMEKEISDQTDVFYGLDGFYNYVDSEGFTRDLETGAKNRTSSRYPDNGSSFSSVAGYFTANHQLNRKLLITGGARYNLVWLNSSTTNAEANSLGIRDVSNFNQALTGILSGIYELSESAKITAVLSSGFRAPNVDDVGKLFELDEETIVVPNPNLKPEYVYSQEISFHQKFNPVTKLDIVIYNSYLTNAIIRGNLPGEENATLNVEGSELQVRTQVNEDQARLYGGTIRIESKLIDHLALFSTLSVNRGETDDGEPLRHATPVFGQTGIRFYRNGLKLSLNSIYNLAHEPDQIPEFEIVDKPHLFTDNGTPGWVSFDLRGSYLFEKTGLSAESGIENILDQHYRPYSSGISAPGRNIFLTLRYRL